MFGDLYYPTPLFVISNEVLLMTSDSPTVSFVIPTHNGEEYIGTCIESIMQQSYDNIDITVVDDNSQDSTKDLVRERYPSVTMISLPNQTHGTCKSTNIGIESSSGEYVAVVDEDVEIPQKWTTKCIDSIEEEEQIGCIATKIVTPDGLQWPSSESADSSFTAGTFNGCGVFFERESLEKTTYYPEHYVIYGNEDQLSAQLLNNGCEIKYDPSIETLHKNSSRGEFNEFRYYYKNRNLIWTSWMHDGFEKTIQFTFIHMASSLLVSLRHRTPAIFIKLTLGTLLGLGRCLRNRNVVTDPTWTKEK